MKATFSFVLAVLALTSIALAQTIDGPQKRADSGCAMLHADVVLLSKSIRPAKHTKEKTKAAAADCAADDTLSRCQLVMDEVKRAGPRFSEYVMECKGR